MTSGSELILNPGDFQFAGGGARMHTLLGSCVSITLWHPRLRVGGMCHYMLPSRPARSGGQPLDGRYADDAIQLFLYELGRLGTHPSEYQVKMFGGGTQFRGRWAAVGLDVARENIEAGLWLLDTHGFTLATSQLGGTGPRRLLFDTSTGNVWLHHLSQTYDLAEGDDQAAGAARIAREAWAERAARIARAERAAGEAQNARQALTAREAQNAREALTAREAENARAARGQWTAPAGRAVQPSRHLERSGSAA